jgi:DNA repair protein RadC
MIVRTARDAAGLLEPLFVSAEQGTVAVIYLDEAQRPIDLGVEDGGEGVEAGLPLRSIFSKALRLGARSIIVARNHPSGDPTPSEADMAAARDLAAAGRQLDVLVHDHLLFGGGEWRSFRALGLL